MSDFTLNEKLKNDCIVLGKLQFSYLLLLNNSLVPWFILVPETDETELYELNGDQQINLLAEINALSALVKKAFNADKLNVATIGNIVSQLHIHIIGRTKNDFCWPGVVWGAQDKKLYSDEEVCKIKDIVKNNLENFDAL